MYTPPASPFIAPAQVTDDAETSVAPSDLRNEASNVDNRPGPSLAGNSIKQNPSSSQALTHFRLGSHPSRSMTRKHRPPDLKLYLEGPPPQVDPQEWTWLRLTSQKHTRNNRFFEQDSGQVPELEHSEALAQDDSSIPDPRLYPGYPQPQVTDPQQPQAKSPVKQDLERKEFPWPDLTRTYSEPEPGTPIYRRPQRRSSLRTPSPKCVLRRSRCHPNLRTPSPKPKRGSPVHRRPKRQPSPGLEPEGSSPTHRQPPGPAPYYRKKKKVFRWMQGHPSDQAPDESMDFPSEEALRQALPPPQENTLGAIWLRCRQSPPLEGSQTEAFPAYEDPLPPPGGPSTEALPVYVRPSSPPSPGTASRQSGLFHVFNRWYDGLHLAGPSWERPETCHFCLMPRPIGWFPMLHFLPPTCQKHENPVCLFCMMQSAGQQIASKARKQFQAGVFCPSCGAVWTGHVGMIKALVTQNDFDRWTLEGLFNDESSSSEEDENGDGEASPGVKEAGTGVEAAGTGVEGADDRFVEDQLITELSLTE